jgi:arylsulfate sulfotransferase
MSENARPIATDLDGNIIWYLRQPSFLTRMLPGGHFLGLGEGLNSANDMRRHQLVREFDLAGNILRETNISRVAEQLASRGIQSDCKKGGEQCVPSFHHEVTRLPNGHTLTLAGIERMFPAGTQGAKERVDILGDLIVDLDENFQVAWVWNAFDHMDVKRAGPPDSKCKIGNGSGGCTAIFLADTANGWLHSNSLNYNPADGSLLISMPEQNWVLKINYQDGKGDGKVLWRLGAEGDFRALTSDPEPWFSFQHDAGLEPTGSNLLTVLDDGHERQKKHPDAHNRGQVWKLDEKNKTAELVYNVDLGVYAIAVGSAQTLSNGGYSFEAGFINPGPTPYGRAIETSADGKVVYAQQVDGMIDYRTFRVPNLYSAPTKR